jgi:hypothetical protein
MRRHASLKQPEVTHVPEAALGLAAPQHCAWIARVLTAASLALSLLILPVQRLPTLVVDVAKKLRLLGGVFVDLPEDKAVEPPSKCRSGIELTSRSQDNAVHVPEPHLALVEFLEQAHS